MPPVKTRRTNDEVDNIFGSDSNELIMLDGTGTGTFAGVTTGYGCGGDHRSLSNGYGAGPMIVLASNDGTSP